MLPVVIGAVMRILKACVFYYFDRDRFASTIPVFVSVFAEFYVADRLAPTALTQKQIALTYVNVRVRYYGVVRLCHKPEQDLPQFNLDKGFALCQ